MSTIQKINDSIAPMDLLDAIEDATTMKEVAPHRLTLELFTERLKTRRGTVPASYNKDNISALWTTLQEKEKQLKDQEGHYDVAKRQFERKFEQTKAAIEELLDQEDCTFDHITKELAKFRKFVFKLKVPDYMWDEYRTYRKECEAHFDGMDGIDAYAG